MKESYEDFLLKCSNKLGFKCVKIFDNEGCLIEDLDVL